MAEPLRIQTDFVPPSDLPSLVTRARNFGSNQVTCLHICCNGVMALVGVALVALAVVVFVLNFKAQGWHPPALYAFLGLFAVGGVVFSIVGLQKMVANCQRRKDLAQADTATLPET